MLHTGDVLRSDHPDPTVDVHGVVSRSGDEALIAATRLVSGPSHHTAPVRVNWLEPDRVFDVSMLGVSEPFGDARHQPAWVDGKLRMSGRQLAGTGFHLPQLLPESSVLIHIVDAASPAR